MKRAVNSRLLRLEDASEMAVDRRGSAIEPTRTVPERAREDTDDSPDDLIGQIRELQTCTLKILRRAEAAGKTDTALKVMREVRCNMELLARLTGQLDRTQPGFSTVIVIPGPTGTFRPEEESQIVDIEVTR